ncbi:hypothetical protein KFE25_012375 [Diacronema lutheri]|uniref:Cyclic nucleotide-binding domain-containing protein n=1 Tax=Diacronema lutheri TaxID=2081491 RepID=A0A8J5XIS8_DIALT|nr:hypothetical protein KFE25_012375 [Diacronema lutheri]
MLGRMPTSAADARAPSMSAAPSKDAMLPTTAPVFVSQLGFSIFFTSCTFVRSLARSGTAQLARGVSDAPPGDQASASSLAGARSQFALTTDVASSASLSPCSWPSATVRLLDARAAGSEPGASSLASSATQATRSCMTNAAEKPSVPTRRSARFTQPRALPITTFAASAQQREAEAAAAADSAEKRVRTAVQRTAVVFHQLLAVFDFDAASFGEAVDDGERPAREGASAQVRLSDVRRLRLQLGESGSQQITALYEHLQRAAIALGAPIVDHEGDGVERSAERRVKEAQAREDKHARDMRSSSERPQPSASVESSDEHVATTDAEDEPPLFDAFQRRPQCEEADAPAALASPAVPARHARATLGGNEDAARLARRAKRALLNEAHFFPAVAAWILSTTADAEEEEAGAEAHSAAGAAQGSPAMPALNLHLKNPPKAHNGLFKDGAAEASPAADEATGASPPGGARLRITESDAALLEALDASLWSAEALTGIADRLAVRLESGRLLRGEAVRAEALLAIIAQAVVVPPDATARMLADVCASRLELELATDDEEGKERRTARRSLLSPEPPTWLSIERALRDAVAAGIANNAWKGGGDAAALVRQDDAAREAGLLGLSTKPWYIASVKSRGYRAAHSSFLLLASIDVLLLPLELVFIKETKTMIWLLDARIAVDAFYIARIAGSFFVSFINEKSVEITEPQACRKAYLAGNCVLDMLAAFPLNLVLMTVGVTPMQFYASRLPRVLNARYCYRRYREWLASIDDEDLFSGMLSTMFIFLLTLHLITTLVKLFGHAQFIRDMTFMTWTDLYEIRRLAVHAQRLAFRQAEAIVVDYYLVSYFQTLSLVTTVGGMPPSNIAEFALQIFIMLVSMTVYAVIVGNLSSLVMKQDDEIIAKRAQLELVQGYVRYIRVPKELKKRLTRFFQQRFKSTSLSAVPADVIYRGLPMEVQIEVSKHTNRAVIEAARILRGCSAGFVDRLSSLLKERAPEAESVIFRTAEACKELIFVAAGVIELYDDHQPGEELAITETRSFGETLGDVPFVFQVRHVHNARAAPDVETRMFVLLSTGYVDLLKTFPDMHDIVMENAIHQHEDDYMRTPLHLAASCKRVSAMQFLLEQEGVDLSAEDVYGATPLDDALREEKDDETKIADVRSMREAIDDAARAEETHGAVLADERPELWEQIRDFAERQRQQHEHVALDIEPMVEGWLDGLDDMAREAMLELRKGIASLLAHHDAQRETRRDPIGRLAEIAFRRPQVALATNDIGASTADMAVITTRSRVMH